MDYISWSLVALCAQTACYLLFGFLAQVMAGGLSEILGAANLVRATCRNGRPSPMSLLQAPGEVAWTVCPGIRSGCIRRSP